MDDIQILRELARLYAEKAADPVNGARKERGYQTNELTAVRPLVWVDEVPWHEMNVEDELTLRCRGDQAREMEFYFRSRLYQWKHFQADTVLEPFYPMGYCWSSTGCGMEVKERVIVKDPKNNIISHAFTDLLDSEEKLAGLTLPTVTRDREREAKRLSYAHEVLDGILPVETVGTYAGWACWDDISRLRGMTAMLTDLYEEPELMHAIIRRFCEIRTAEVDQMEALGLFSSKLMNLHCTPPYSRALEKEEAEHGSSCRCTWMRATAQAFGQVSPAMHEEFEMNYLIPLASRFGYSYYGCCEALFDRISVVKKLPNLRKVGVSPWSKVEPSAEQLGKDFVFARKPNPALVAGCLNEDAIRRETRETVEACLKYGCPYEFVLKDISTVGYRPQNLWRWTEIVEQTIDEYY